jgi:hypothetical protein
MYGLVQPSFGKGYGAGAGKGKGKGAWGGQKGGAPQWGAPQQWGIPELQNSLDEAFRVVDNEPELPEIMKKINQKINKCLTKYDKDERLNFKSTSTQAKVIVEEFVEHLMSGMAGCCYGSDGNLKPWFGLITFTNPLLILVLHKLGDSKIFARTLKPTLIKHIEDGYQKWLEDERITRAIADVVDGSGILESHKKKANQQLAKSFDSAHMKAPYGSTVNASPELAVLQDFVKGWMKEFVEGGWDVLENGLTDTSRESQIAHLTTIFQSLMDPNIAVVPLEIIAEISNSATSGGAMPATPWAFVGEVAEEVYKETEIANQPSQKKLKKMGLFA